MSKTFRPWKIEEPLLLPVTVADFVAESHLARFVLSVVRDEVDLGKITGTYGSELGQPPFNPIMMTALLLYAYCSGIYSSRRIAKACGERVDFMSIVGLDVPNFRTISDFRKRHLKALSELFKQVLLLCEKAGLVKLGHVALDGTKVKANASKHKAMSYGRMAERATELRLPVGSARPKRRTPKRTSFTAATRPARSCRTGSPTSSGVRRRSGRPRPNWRRRRRQRPKPNSKSGPLRRRSGKPRAGAKAAGKPLRLPRRRMPKPRRTSPIPRAGS